MQKMHTRKLSDCYTNKIHQQATCRTISRTISKIFLAEFSSSDDFYILKALNIKQVLVTCDDINASSGICTVNEFVVIRISAHFKSCIRDDHAACFCNLSNGNIYTFLRIFVLKFFEGFVILLQYFRSNKRFQLFSNKASIIFLGLPPKKTAEAIIFVSMTILIWQFSSFFVQMQLLH